MESDSKLSNRHDLTEDLWGDILKRLPVKTLVRFRCVCKSWNSLISSSAFVIGHHLDNHIVEKSYIVCDNSPVKGSYAFYIPRVTSLVVEHPKFLRFPFQTLISPLVFFVDVIHGVVCISKLFLHNSFILWNPRIHKFLQIPPSPSFLELRHSGPTALGFGVDASKKHDYYDFKVVKLFPIRYSKQLTYEVFSSRQGSWRKAFSDHIGPGLLFIFNGYFANGSIHWIALRQFNDEFEFALLIFDCESEELKTIDLPPEFNQAQPTAETAETMIFTYRGLLSVFVHNKFQRGIMWAMEEYGVASSWKKLSAIFPDDDFVKIEKECVYVYHEDREPTQLLKGSHLIEELRVKEPLMGHVLRESLFLMDDETAKPSLIHEEQG